MNWMMRPVRHLCAVASILLLTAAAASAQLATAELNGRVTDSSGAVLPGATVTATQTGTGLERTVVTDETGSYLLSNLPVGPYRLEISLQGFRSYAQTGLVLTVGATPTVNAALELGSLEETVTVEAAAPIVDVRSAGISNVVENEEILALPLNGRRCDLVVMSGAAVQTAVVSPRLPGRREHLGGRRPLDRRRLHAGRRDAQQPAAERESAAAVPGRAAGVPRRDERPDRTERRELGRVGQRRDEVGHQPFLGERVRVPAPPSIQFDEPLCADRRRRRARGRRSEAQPVRRHVRRADHQDRLFFFGAYQGTAIRQRPSANIAFVPTPAMLAGDFTTFASPACNGGRQVNLRAGS